VAVWKRHVTWLFLTCVLRVAAKRETCFNLRYTKQGKAKITQTRTLHLTCHCLYRKNETKAYNNLVTFGKVTHSKTKTNYIGESDPLKD
jgi:hypothetical protein